VREGGAPKSQGERREWGVCANLLAPSQGSGELSARVSLCVVVMVVLFLLVPWNDPCMLLL
jgi:hypothetical protein